MADFVFDAFDLADKYRNPAMILADGALGQMMEKVSFREYDVRSHLVQKPWATTGKAEGRERNIITSLYIQPDKMEQINLRLDEKYRRMKERETRSESILLDDADLVIVAYGLSARIAHRAVELAREQGLRVGLLRPITLFPFPTETVQDLARRTQGMLVVEMNAGQMVEDVRLAVEGKVPVQFYGRMGGIIPSPEEVVQALQRLASTTLEVLTEE
jgi:2-oxoglutarate ferredoxin oxidoreductase subunit alpha